MRDIVNFSKKLIPKRARQLILQKYLSAKFNVKFGSSVVVDRDSVFEGNNFLNDHSTFLQSYLGRGSYIAGHSYLYKASVGRFCSIGQFVKNDFALHPSNSFVSTHPAFFSVKKQAGYTFVTENKFNEIRFADKDGNWLVKIGNDVWIGHNVNILDGVTIGDGAIIGAGSLITKNVEPYSIVGGVPAKIIRMRFTDEQRDFLLKYKWWDKDMSWLKKNADSFSSVDEFIKNSL